MMRAIAGLFSKRCPHCKSILFRSVGPRNGFEETLIWLFQPFRCSLCGHHFFLLRRVTGEAYQD